MYAQSHAHPSGTSDRARAKARDKGLGLVLAFEAEFESLPPKFSFVADASDGRLRCLLIGLGL